MINQRDVAILYMPFPSIHSHLAFNKHMYICLSNSPHVKEFVKNQTFKPYHLTGKVVKNFLIEEADSSRNPFIRTTLIDLDKVFVLDNVVVPLHYLTHIRRDIASSLYQQIIDNLHSPQLIRINKQEFIHLNPDCY